MERLFGLLICLCVPLTARAELRGDDYQGMYVAVGYGKLQYPSSSPVLDDFTRATFTRSNFSQINFTSDVEADGKLLQLTLGARLLSYLALELNVQKLHQFSYSARGTAMSQGVPVPIGLEFRERSDNTMNLAVLLFGPTVLRLQPYLRLGGATMDHRISGRSMAGAQEEFFNDDNQNSDWYGGAGITYHGPGLITARLEWQSVPALDDTRKVKHASSIVLDVIFNLPL